MRGEDQHVTVRVAAVEQAALELGLHLSHLLRVAAGRRGRAGELVQEPVLVDERQRGQPDPLLPAARRILQDPPVTGEPEAGDELQPRARRPAAGRAANAETAKSSASSSAGES